MLDERIRKDLTDRYQSLLAAGELTSKAQLDAYCTTFRRRFGPAVLGTLDGEALLTSMHDYGSRDSLTYWLEFKNDEEFPTLQFGGIGGGTALKFGIYKRSETGVWMTGSPVKQRELTTQEAVAIARRHRDQLMAGAEILGRFDAEPTDAAYAELQRALTEAAPNIQDTAWGHKYLYLMYPDKLDAFHVEYFQRFHLVKLLQLPPITQGRYSCAGRFVELSQELGWPMQQLTNLLGARHGRPHRYWRVLANYAEQDFRLYDMMRTDNCVAIGWAKVGDLSALKYDQASRVQVRTLMKQHYNSPGRWANEVFWFATLMAEGDLVIAFEGQQILGIGRVRGGYQYVADSHAPHRHEVEWLDGTTWSLPEDEAVAAAVREIKLPRNQLEIEQHLLEPVLPPIVAKVQPPIRPATTAPRPHIVPALPGIPGRVQAVLERKRQVILYGPPGTGKTYWARLAAADLAAFAEFGTTFDQLAEELKKVVLGGEADQAALVRLCAFHPAYGYEDFLEGYRPLSRDGQLAFESRDGIFKRLCDDARTQPDRHFFLVIDEINRGDIPRIFGELITVLELDKRGQSILLPLSGQPFSVPDNVYLIGTMNTADRSIALLDTALRRRFGFVELMPDSKVLGDTVVGGVPLGRWLDALNRRICLHVGRDARNLQVGHAYLMDGGKPVKEFARLARMVQDDIIPLLQEYCYEDYDALEKILGPGLVDRANQQIRHGLFDAARCQDLEAALLALEPDIATSIPATAAEAEALVEEPDESEDGDGATAQSHPEES